LEEKVNILVQENETMVRKIASLSKVENSKSMTSGQSKSQHQSKPAGRVPGIRNKLGGLSRGRTRKTVVRGNKTILVSSDWDPHWTSILPPNPNKLVRDLLYTLNSRGYETLRDGDGHLIDLNKCKGEALLELKGRTVNPRAAGKIKSLPGRKASSNLEITLRAMLGAQEKCIQGLVQQLREYQNKALLGVRVGVGAKVLERMIGVFT
jgi:hypothetical protein